MSGLMNADFGSRSDGAAPASEKQAVRHYTAEDLRKATSEVVKGKKCPHGRRPVVVSSHVEVREDDVFGGTAARTTTRLVVEAACPHDEDRRSMTYERAL